MHYLTTINLWRITLTNASSTIISIQNLTKTFSGGVPALKGINLEINRGEILALLGPNGAGKTTLISIICGIVNASSGSVTVDGLDIKTHYRQCRSKIGLVPQEITLTPFERVKDTVAYSRGLYGKPANKEILEKTLRQLSLHDKTSAQVIALSGGMKRRVLIAKAMIHEPPILFLDEPTAGVDVELRKDMWEQIEKLKHAGTTIILTTHYIEEAEAIADRVGIIDKGELILVEEKKSLVNRMGRKQLNIDIQAPIEKLPKPLSFYNLEIVNDGKTLVFSYEVHGERTGITTLLNEIKSAGIIVTDIETQQSSLEDIFVNLVKGQS